MRALKMSVVAGQWKVTMKNWEQSLKLILLKLHEKLPKNSKTTILWSFSIWSELERWKDSISGCIMSLLQKKNHHFEVSSSLILCKTTNHFLIRLWSALTSEIYTTDDDQFSDSTKKKLQSTSQIQTCTKYRSWSLFGGQLPIWPTTTSWILTKPLYQRRMLSKSVWCTENYNACRQEWSTDRAQFFSMTMPDHMLHTNASKVEQVVLQGFALSAIFTWPPTSQLPLLEASGQGFAGENASSTSRRQKMLS